jgi:outer membrane protein OmpA-like peptidoglycan-associated protein
LSSITIEEIRTADRYPLLNYIFFAENDGATPLRQHLLKPEETGQFAVDDAKGNELEIYTNMMNIVGRRLKDNSKAKVVLTGTNADVGAEKNATALSRKRAETVKQYLVDVWGIDSRRITVRQRNLPSDPAAMDNAQGQEENRRVEITTDDPSILAPIRRDQIEYRPSPAIVSLVPSVDAPNGISIWSLDVRQGGREVFKANTALGSFPAPIVWNVNTNDMQRTGQALEAHLMVKDEKNQVKEVRKPISVQTLTLEKKRQERIGNVLISRSKLILFDYDKSTISNRNRAIIEDIVSGLTSKSRVEIIGYTDLLGIKEHNLTLSQQRADAVRAIVGKLVTGTDITTKGVGSKQLLFSNDTPEGRFFCRSVHVIVATEEE